MHPLNGKKNVKAMPHKNNVVDHPLTLEEVRAYGAV